MHAHTSYHISFLLNWVIKLKIWVSSIIKKMLCTKKMYIKAKEACSVVLYTRHTMLYYTPPHIITQAQMLHTL